MEEEAEFRDFAAQPNATQLIFNRMAPNIFGHEQIKKAVACLLFGGARKVLSPFPPYSTPPHPLPALTIPSPPEVLRQYNHLQYCNRQ